MIITCVHSRDPIIIIIINNHTLQNPRRQVEISKLRRSRLLENLERREDRLRRNSQSMRNSRRRSTQSDLLIRDQIDSMSSATSFLSTHAKLNKLKMCKLMSTQLNF